MWKERIDELRVKSKKLKKKRLDEKGEKKLIAKEIKELKQKVKTEGGSDTE